jgi:hypothetical protein
LITGMATNWFEAPATFRKCTLLKASFILLSQFDLAFTVLAVSLGFTEINPLMNYLIHMPVLLLVLKLAIPVLIAWLIPGRLLLPSIALLALVAIWNIKEMLFFMFQG